MDKAGKKLYRKLGKDAHWVSDRERRYAEQALAEKKFAVRDAQIGRKNKQPSRVANSLQEAKICDAFYNYRMEESRNFDKLAHKYLKKAR